MQQQTGAQTHKLQDPWLKAADAKAACREAAMYVGICMMLNGNSAPTVQHRMKQSQGTYRK